MFYHNHSYRPATPEQDANILRNGLRKTLIIMFAGAAVYVIAAVLSLWR